jgi:acetylornithine deacetylase/succinyl-diaminopimelate desuccinylase-like protein
MSERLARLHADVDSRAEEHIETLRGYVQRPSRTGYLDELSDFATEFVAELRAAGWEADAVPLDDLAPVIHARIPAPPGGKTLLLYSHYDVITPEPESEWTYPPFDATRVDGKIVGRGSSDAKANLLSLLKGIETIKRVEGSLPCGFVLVVDGEEERGSGNLPTFIERYRDEFGADAALSFDGSIDVREIPKIGLGTAGMLFVELEVSVPSGREIHSALARLYPNPAWRLSWALASIKDADERVQLEGFYDDIVPPTDEDRRLMAAMPWDDVSMRDEAKIDHFLTGVTGLDALERLLYQPGLAICGLESGFLGVGPKASIPSRAVAKLEFRIVPNQTPEGVLEQLRTHLAKHGFDDVEIRVHSTVETAKTEPGADIVDACVRAGNELYGGSLLKPTEEYAGRQGAWLGEMLGIPGVQTGVGSPGSRQHASDEFVMERHYLLGIKYAIGIFTEYTQ